MVGNLPIAVTCKGIKKTFGQGPAAVEALRGVDLEVPQGKLLMLMGPSGSGKTTLISVIAGILTPTAGECFIGQDDLQHMNDRDRTVYRGRHIGFVFQAFNLIPTLNAAENVAIPLMLLGKDRKAAQLRAEEMLKRVGIGEKANAFPRELSGGQQQRVAIARSIIHDPDLIVCDEPTSYLDHETGVKVMELLRSLVSEQRKTLIVVSHDVRIVSFADQIAHLDDGRIVKEK